MNVTYITSIKTTSTKVYYRGGNKYTVFRDENGEIIGVLKEPHIIRPEYVNKLLIF